MPREHLIKTNALYKYISGNHLPEKPLVARGGQCNREEDGKSMGANTNGVLSGSGEKEGTERGKGHPSN